MIAAQTVPVQNSSSTAVMPTYPIRIGALMVAAALLFAGILSYAANVMIPPLEYTASAAAAFASGASTTSIAPVREIHIADDGLVLLRGAAVASIGSGIIRCSVAFNGSPFMMAIKTDASTKFFTRFGEKATIDQMINGSFIEVTGMLVQGGSEPTIDAQFVRQE